MTAATIDKNTTLKPSFANALAHFLPITIFPFMFAAAYFGGWWILAPYLFFLSVGGPLDRAFGMDARNIDPQLKHSRQLIWYSFPVWIWAFLWPCVFVFTLWQIFIVGNHSIFESVLLGFMLGFEGQAIFIVGHELIHRRSKWERYVGEFLLASGSYPHYATEHFYIHHAHVGTPFDVGSAPKGQSLWQYFPRELRSNISGAWATASARMRRMKRPLWHFSNPFWRYGIETAAWYVLVFAIGGWIAVAIYMLLCLMAVFSMKISNYFQHYGLTRVRLPNGRYERVRPHHSWSANYRFSKWMFFNMQRHADHHVSDTRVYPLLQHHAADKSPQLPDTYSDLMIQAMMPKRWFAKMDPLVDQWRRDFYPDIKDWSAYDSSIAKKHPEAFDKIAEIFAAAPRLAQVIERNPQMLDILQKREFTELELPVGFGADTESEKIARTGLVRVYWMHDMNLTEMKAQLDEMPVHDADDAAQIIHDWMNDKVFQVGMHTLRGNLTLTESALVLANIAEASLSALFDAVLDDFTEYSRQSRTGSLAVLVLGDLAVRQMAPRTNLDIRFVCEADSQNYYASMSRRFVEVLGNLTNDNLLFEPFDVGDEEPNIITRHEFANRICSNEIERDSEEQKLVFARCIFTDGDPQFDKRLSEQRHKAILKSSATPKVPDEHFQTADPQVRNILHDSAELRLDQLKQAANYLHLCHYSQLSQLDINADALSVFQQAQSQQLITKDLANQLIENTLLWINLCGILKLAFDDSRDMNNAADTVKTTVAKSCGMPDFAGLIEAVCQADESTDKSVLALVSVADCATGPDSDETTVNTD